MEVLLPVVAIVGFIRIRLRSAHQVGSSRACENHTPNVADADTGSCVDALHRVSRWRDFDRGYVERLPSD